MRVVFWISAVAIVVAQAAILRTARSYISAPASASRQPSPWLEGFWAFAPAVMLAGILYVAWGAL